MFSKLLKLNYNNIYYSYNSKVLIDKCPRKINHIVIPIKIIIERNFPSYFVTLKKKF